MLEWTNHEERRVRPTVPDGYVLEFTAVFDAQHLGTLSFRTGFRAIC